MIKKELLEIYEGKEVHKYTLTDGITVVLTDIGARIISILAPDKNGKMTDVLLGFNDVDGMLKRSSYMGATVGRSANRIGNGGVIEINGKTYQLTDNGNGAHKHGGVVGFDKKMFATEIDEKSNSVTMTCESADGDEGYPGNLKLSVKFTVKGGKVIIEYFAVCDKDTILNPTNHAYFNLNGESDGSILDNVVQINADAYLPMNETFVTTGVVKKVDGTPFDFRKPKTIGRDIEADDEDLKIAGGYDHNFCLADEHFATAYSTKTGIQLDCYTDMPGVQFYVGNSLKGREGKSVYPKRSGFCFETQFYPDAIHKLALGWKSPILKKGENFYSKTEYEFSVRK